MADSFSFEDALSTGTNQGQTSFTFEDAAAASNGPRSAIGEVGTGIKRGVIGELPKVVGQAMQWAGEEEGEGFRRTMHDVGEGIAESAEERLKNPNIQLQPDQHNAVTNALAAGGEMLAPSIAPAAVAGLGLAAIPGVAATSGLGLAAASLAGAVPLGMSQAQDTYERVQEAGGDKDAARAAGWKTGAIETLGETAGTYLGGKLLGIGGKVLKKGAQKTMGNTIGAATDTAVLKPFGKQLVKTALGEVATEMGQGSSQAYVEREAGVNTDPWTVAKESIAPTLGMTALLAPFGLAGFYNNSRRADAIDQTLTDPAAATPEERLQVVDMLHRDAKKQGVPDADEWRTQATLDVAQGLPVRRTVGEARPQANIPPNSPLTRAASLLAGNTVDPILATGYATTPADRFVDRRADPEGWARQEEAAKARNEGAINRGEVVQRRAKGGSVFTRDIPQADPILTRQGKKKADLEKRRANELAEFEREYQRYIDPGLTEQEERSTFPATAGMETEDRRREGEWTKQSKAAEDYNRTRNVRGEVDRTARRYDETLGADFEQALVEGGVDTGRSAKTSAAGTSRAKTEPQPRPAQVSPWQRAEMDRFELEYSPEARASLMGKQPMITDDEALRPRAEWLRQEKTALAQNKARNFPKAQGEALAINEEMKRKRAEAEEARKRAADPLYDAKKRFQESYDAQGTVPEVEYPSDQDAKEFEGKVRAQQKAKQYREWMLGLKKKQEEDDRLLQDESVPEDVRKAAASQVEEIVNADPVYAHMAEAKKRGKLNLSAFKADYDADTVRRIQRRYPGIFSQVGTVQPDDFAAEMGYESLDAMVRRFAEARTKAELTAQILRERLDEWQRAESAQQQEAEFFAAKAERREGREWLKEAGKYQGERPLRTKFPATDEEIGYMEDMIRRHPDRFTDDDLDHWTYTAEQQGRLRKALREAQQGDSSGSGMSDNTEQGQGRGDTVAPEATPPADAAAGLSGPLNGIPKVGQPAGDRVLADTKIFGDSANAEAIVSEGFESFNRDVQHVILSKVAAAIHDEKIFNAVVKSVPIDVMNDLVGRKLSPDMLLDNQAVLGNRLSVPGDKPIPKPVARFINALASSIEVISARLGAEESRLPPSSLPAKSNSAAEADSQRGDDTGPAAERPLGGSDPAGVPGEIDPTGGTSKLDDGHIVISLNGGIDSVNTTPSEAQKQAGVYKKGHFRLYGLDISIENPAGSTRSGVDPDGKRWEVPIRDHYGYIKGTVGKDKDHLDVFIPEGFIPTEKDKVFVVNQIDPKTGKFDEHKIVFGSQGEAAARTTYLRNYDKTGPERVGSVAEMSVDEFKGWLDSGNTAKPASPIPDSDSAAGETQPPSPGTDETQPDLPGAGTGTEPSPGEASNIKATTGGEDGETLRRGEEGAADYGTTTNGAGGQKNATRGGAAGSGRAADVDQPQREQWELTAAEWEKEHARDRRLEREAIEKVDRLKRQPRPKSVSANIRYLEKISAAEKVLREASENANRWGGEAVRKEVVRRAHESGKPVPSAVLAEFPDIASNAPAQQSADMADVPETDFGEKKAAQPSASKATMNELEAVVAQKRAMVERTLAATKKGTKAQKEAAGRKYLFAKKELQGWEQALEDVRAEQQPPTTPQQDRTPEKPEAEQLVRWQNTVNAYVNGEDAANARTDTIDRALQNGLVKPGEAVAFAEWLVGQGGRAGLVDHARARQTAPAAPAGKRPAQYGQANKVFTVDAAEKARAILSAKLKNQLSSGLDPELMQAGITLAGYHIEAGARKFADYARAMIADLGGGIKPYLRSLYEGVRYYPGMPANEMSAAAEIDGIDVDALSAEAQDTDREQPTKEDANVAQLSGNTDLERDSQDAGAQNGVGQEGVQPERGTDGRTGQPGARGAEGGHGVNGGVQGVSRHEAAPVGKRGDLSPYSADGQSESAASPAGSDDGQRGGDLGLGGPGAEHVSATAVGKTASVRSALESRIEAQKKAARLKVQPSSRENISETLPLLHKGQQDDVHFAEKRFSKPDGYGVLFTNGTGTGKTFSALGIIKRFEMQGKKDVLVIAPDNIIIDAWTKAAGLFGLELNRLADTKDPGSGITVTTYANFSSNDALAKRNWDLIVADESHQLGMNQSGEATKAINALRAIAMHPRGVFDRTRMLNAELYAEIQEQSKIAKESKSDKDQKKLNALWTKYQAKIDETREQVDAAQGEARPRVVMLSATPFAYDKNIDIAEGFLFDYGPEETSGGYNSGSAYDRFMMQHFGYSMRYNKLTRPDKEVNSGLMQRQFNSWLKKQGVLSSRVLDVDFNYDRKFILAESAIGQKIDEGVEFLWNNKRYRALGELMRKRFDYLSQRYLLEAIKAKEVIPIIKEHLALGRKVVVFHDYIKGGGFHPFDFSGEYGNTDGVITSEYGDDQVVTESIGDLARAFAAERPDLVNLPISNMASPITTLSKAFPDLLVVNGQTVTKKEAQANVNAFNDDNTGPAVLLVQSDKDKGWSGHDTSGKHQRVLINLGLPTRPTRAIQQEGRIYRVGQASDAIIRYVNTGTNWERWAFASTIAQRASTAENLAMGEEARALMDSFVQAFEESDTYSPGHENEGKGGKERDAAANAALTEWDRATTMYFAQQKKTARTKAREGRDYFATPEPLGLKMVEWANVQGGEKVLEPSAGHGAIARWFPDNAEKTVVEPSSELASRLKMVTDGRLVQDTFENLDAVNKFDAIVMNPPFGTAGKTAGDHIEKAIKHLRDGGRIVALIPRGPSMDKRLDNILYGADAKGKPLHPDIYLVASYVLPTSVFERAGTSVATRVVILDKHTDKETAAKIQQQGERDYSDEQTIKDFFARIENSFVRERVPVKAVAAPGTPPAVPREDGEQVVEYTTKKGKVLRGVVRKITKAQAQEIDPYTFKLNGGFFIREKYLQADEGASQGTATGEENITYAVSEPRGDGGQAAGVVRDRAGAGVRAEGGQLDLFTGATVPSLHQRRAKKSLFAQVKHAAAGKFTFSGGPVGTMAEIAGIAKPIMDEAQESNLLVMLDENNMPVAVLKHSVGGKASGPIDPGVVLGVAHSIKAAKTIWSVHNHPSGTAVLSPADRGVATLLANATRGTGINFAGLVAVTPGGRFTGAHYLDGEIVGGDDFGAAIADKGATVRGITRKIKMLSDQRAITSNDGVSLWMMDNAPGQSGVLLLDNRNRPSAFVPMETATMAKLRTGEKGTGASELLATAEQVNATSLIAVSTARGEQGVAAVRNVAVFAHAHAFNMLDALVDDQSVRDLVRETIDDHKWRGGAKSAASAFFSKGQSVPDATPADIPAELSAKYGRLRARRLLGRRVTVLKSQEEARRVDRGQKMEGAKYSKGGLIQGFFLNGRIYLVRDGIQKGEAADVLEHEIAHATRLNIRSTAAWGRILRSIEQRTGDGTATGKALAEARALVPGDTAPDLVAEETLAYLIEKDRTDIGLVRRFIALVKKALVEMGVSPDIFTAGDFKALAASAARSASGVSVREQAMFSIGESIRQAKAFFSKLQQVSDDKFGGMKAQSVEPFLLKQGVKKTEIEATGLREWLAAMKPTDKVTREQLADFVRANTVEFEDVVLGDEYEIDPEIAREFHELDRLSVTGGSLTEEQWRRKAELQRMIDKARDEKQTHFSAYTEPGAVPGSYREMFVTAPPSNSALVSEMKKLREIDSERSLTFDEEDRLMDLDEMLRTRVHDFWRDGHSQYSEIDNPIVRIRFNEVAGPNGERVLRVEEMQGPSEANQEKMPKYLRDNIYQTGVKRILAYAKEHGFDGVALTTKPGRTAGETQADRYNLRQQVDNIEYVLPERAKEGWLYIDDADGNQILRKRVTPQELGRYIGAENAKRILSMKAEDAFGTRILSGANVKVGGEGLKQLYDTDLPNIFNAWGGAKMGDLGGMPYIPVDKAASSYPMFSKRDLFKPVDTNSAAFKRWFGKSVVTDADGKPLRVYHGTPRVGFEELDVSNVGAFFSDRFDIAVSYAGGYNEVEMDGAVPTADDGQGVYDVYLKITNPLEVDWEGNIWSEGPDGLRLDDVANRAKRNGHDGLIVNNVVDVGGMSPGIVEGDGGGRVFVIFQPEQAKSASFNTGAFSPTDPRIRYSKASPFKPVDPDSPALRRWLGNSQITEPVFHGSPSEFWTFDRNRMGERTGQVRTGLGFFFARDRNEAAGYAGPGGSNRAFYVKIENPRRMHASDLPRMRNTEEAQAFAKRMQLAGHDGIILEDEGHVVVFEPNQVKSAEINTGAFDRRNPDVRYSIASNPAAAAERQRVLGDQTKRLLDSIAKKGLTGTAEQQLFATMAEGLDIVDTADANLKTKAWDWFKSLPKAAARKSLGALTLRQLRDVFAKNIPQMDTFYEASRAIAADANRVMTAADQIYNRWASLDKQDAKAMSEVMIRSTIAGVNPDVAKFEPRANLESLQAGIDRNLARAAEIRAKGEAATADEKVERLQAEAGARRKAARIQNEVKRRSEFEKLATMYQGLSKEAKEVYQSVRKQYDDNLTALFDALKDRVERQIKNPEQRKSAIDAIRLRYDKFIKEGPYFPLSRFGDYIAIAEMGDRREVRTFDSMAERTRYTRQRRAEGWTVQEKTKKEFNRETQGASGTFFEGVIKIINESEGLDAGERKSIIDEVNQHFIKSMPDLSHRKHFVHRRKVEGYSRDQMRAFADNMQHAAHHIARIRHADKMTAAVESVLAESRMLDKDANGDAYVDLHNELVKRLEIMNNPNISPVTQAVTSFGFLMNIGPSIASALVNISQTPLVAFPILANRFKGLGAITAMNALTKASADYFTSKPSWASGPSLVDNKKLPREERDMIRALIDDGTIDVTQAHSLAQAAGSDYLNLARTKYGHIGARAMRLVAYPFHIAELANRKITALAAYRMARKSGMGHGEAVAATREAVLDSHFDYTQANRARWMEGNVRRVLLLFKQYSQQMTWLLGRSFHQAAKGETKEVRQAAARQLGMILAGHFMVAGAMGLPVLGGMVGALSFLGNLAGDDDEPKDLEVSLRNFLADTFGAAGGDAVMNGPWRMLPGIGQLDVANRMSLGDLWFRAPNREMEGRDQFNQYVNLILGPVANNASNVFMGANSMANGEVWRGIEMMLPKAVKDGMKAIRYSTEGVKNWKSDTLLEDLGAIELFGQALGFTPARVSEMYAGANAVKNYETRIERRRKVLMNRWVNAIRKRDAEGAREAMEEITAFNAKNPIFRIDYQRNLVPSLRNRMRVQSQTKEGVYVPATRDEIRQVGRFANV